jgi:hypothetical protein
VSGNVTLTVRVTDSALATVERDLQLAIKTLDTGFRPNPHGYAFKNFSVPDLDVVPGFGWAFFRNTYGADEVELFGKPRPMALCFYNKLVRSAAASGSCFGMSASSLVLFTNSHRGWDLGSDKWAFLDGGIGEPYTDANYNGRYDIGEVYWDINGNGSWDAMPKWGVIPDFIQRPAEWVEYFHVRCVDEAVQTNKRVLRPNDIYAQLRDRMAGVSWSHDPLVLGILYGTVWHAVVPCRIEAADDEGADLRIYDNNVPGQEQTMRFNLVANTLSYANNIWGPNLGGVCVVDLSAITSEPQIPRDFDCVTPLAHLLYTDLSGNQLGYVGGVFKDEIAGAYMFNVFGQMDAQGFPETFRIGNLNLKRQVLGENAGRVQVSVARPGSLLVVELDVAPGTVDEIVVPPEGHSIEIIAGRNLTSVSLTLDSETSTLARQVHIDVGPVPLGDSVYQSLSQDLESWVVVNQGQTKTFQLWMEQIGLSSGKYTEGNAVQIAANSSIWFHPSDWNDLARTPVQLDYDLGNDGTIDYTAITSQLRATVKVDPSTLILGSKGIPITAYLQLPKEYPAKNIDVSTVQIVTLQGRRLAQPIPIIRPYGIGDYNQDGIADLMVKFDRATVANSLQPGTADVGMIGRLADGTYFTGSGSIRVLAH